MGGMEEQTSLLADSLIWEIVDSRNYLPFSHGLQEAKYFHCLNTTKCCGKMQKHSSL